MAQLLPQAQFNIEGSVAQFLLAPANASILTIAANNETALTLITEGNGASGGTGASSFAELGGNPVDNAALADELAAKADATATAAALNSLATAKADAATTTTALDTLDTTKADKALVDAQLGLSTTAPAAPVLSVDDAATHPAPQGCAGQFAGWRYDQALAANFNGLDGPTYLQLGGDGSATDRAPDRA